jgi:hypothetical protein
MCRRIEGAFGRDTSRMDERIRKREGARWKSTMAEGRPTEAGSQKSELDGEAADFQKTILQRLRSGSWTSVWQAVNGK